MYTFLFIAVSPTVHSARCQVRSTAETSASKFSFDSLDSTRVEDESSTFAVLGVFGFIPLNEGYRINYKTQLASLPIEIAAGFAMPLSSNLQLPVLVRYTRRVASFIENTSVVSIAFEPGIKLFIERARAKDFRLFAGGAVLITSTTIASMIDATPDGNDPQRIPVSKNYLNLGLAFQVGVAYPVSTNFSLDAAVHVSNYFSPSAETGGIGNLGGVSLGIEGQYGF